jgi:hypothetical protein
MITERDGREDDEFLASLVSLPRYDVSPRRSRHLRRRCHVMLHAERPAMRAEPPVTTWHWMMAGVPFRRVIVPALGGAWCLAYLVEIIRRTAAIYSHAAAP